MRMRDRYGAHGTATGDAGRNDWRARARCRQLVADGEVDWDTWYPLREGGEHREVKLAKQFCNGCPVMYECLEYALDHREEYGIWGSLTARERRAIFTRRRVA